jgi:heptosyltransferase-1
MSTSSNLPRIPPSVERILVIRLGALGDVLRTIPAVQSLRALCPDARLAWLVEPASAGVLALVPEVDDVLVFPRHELMRSIRAGRPDRLVAALRRSVGPIRDARFDCVVDFHGILKSGVLSWLSGAPMRVAPARPHAREGSWLMATHRAPLVATRQSRYARNAAIAGWLGAGESDGPRHRLRVPQAAVDRMSARLGDGGAGVVLHPGTSAGTPYKRWAPSRFAALARMLASETGAPCLVTRGPEEDERRLAQFVVDAADGAARLAPPTDDLVDLAALLACAPMFIGNDSGPLHLASLLGTPVVQILGPSDPVENAPFRVTPNRVVRVPVPCSPCRRGCADPVCLEAVDVARVADAARSLRASQVGNRTSPPWRAA